MTTSMVWTRVARFPSPVPPCGEPFGLRVPPGGRRRTGDAGGRLVGVQTQPAQGLGSDADLYRAPPGACPVVRAGVLEEVQADLPGGERHPVDTALAQSGAKGRRRARGAGGVPVCGDEDPHFSVGGFGGGGGVKGGGFGRDGDGGGVGGTHTAVMPRTRRATRRVLRAGPPRPAGGRRGSGSDRSRPAGPPAAPPSAGHRPESRVIRRTVPAEPVRRRAAAGGPRRSADPSATGGSSRTSRRSTPACRSTPPCCSRAC